MSCFFCAHMRSAVESRAVQSTVLLAGMAVLDHIHHSNF